MKTVQLVLGSDGARGFAHIAIIEGLLNLSKNDVFELMDFTLKKKVLLKEIK